MTTPAQRLAAAVTRLDDAEGTLAGPTATLIGAWLTRVRAALLSDPGVTPSLDAFPTDDEWAALATEHLEPVARSLFAANWDLTMADLIPGPDRDAVTVDRGPAVDRFARDLPNRIKGFPRESWEVLRAEIADGIAANETVDQLRDRVGAVTGLDAPSRALRARIAGLDAQIAAEPDPSARRELRARRARLNADRKDADTEWQWRARRIARTEATAAVNGGEHLAMSARRAASGVKLRKQWMATSDYRVRLAHALANGQVRDWDEPFTIAGHHMAYPGDPTAPGSLVINCRCALITLADGDEPLPLAPIGVDPDAITAASTGEPMKVVADYSPALSTRLTSPSRVASSAGGKSRAFTSETAGGAAPAELPNGWRGLLVPLDVESGDQRVIGTPGVFRARPLPLPLLGQEALSMMGHDGAVLAGRIDRTWVEDGAVYGEGAFDLSDPEGAAWARRIADGFAGGVSVDLDDVIVSEVFLDAQTGEEMDPEEAIEILLFDPAGDKKVRYQMRVDDWRLMGATIVHQPAFHQARIEPVYGYVPAPAEQGPPSDRAAASVQLADTPPADDTSPKFSVGDRVVATAGERDGTAGEVTAVNEGDETADVVFDGDRDPTPSIPFGQLKAEGSKDDSKKSGDDKKSGDGKGSPPPFPEQNSLAAATAGRRRGAGPLRPPAEWFTAPTLPDGTGLTIDAAGRVWGHLALWNTCHTGSPDMCLTPPRTATDYAMFHTGEVLTRDGQRLAVGRLTVGGGHADPRDGMAGAIEHYDNAGACVAVVCASEDAHGIVIAGAIVPDATPDQVAALRRSPLSGDWRRVGGNLELVAALAVCSPGFPIPRPRAAAAAGLQTSLVAAGVLPRAPHPAPASQLGASQLGASLARTVRRTRIEQLAGRMPTTAGDRWPLTRAALAGVPQTERDLAEATARRRGFPG